MGDDGTTTTATWPRRDGEYERQDILEGEAARPRRDRRLHRRPEDQQRALQHVRHAIRAAAPDAEESFVYGVPGFKLDGKALACYAGFKRHCGFYPMSPEAIESHASELQGCEIAKGTIRFEARQPLPASLVEALVKARAAEVKRK